MSAPVLFVLCVSLLDLSTDVSPAVVEELQLRHGAHQAVDREAMRQVMDAMNSEGSNVRESPGGCGLNTARVFQWMMATEKEEDAGRQQHHSRERSHVAFAGFVGDDRPGRLIRDTVRPDGVHLLLSVDSRPTGICACLVVDGERTMVVQARESQTAMQEGKDCTKRDEWRALLFEEQVQQSLHSAQFLFATAFLANRSPAALQLMAQHAAEHNKVFCLTLAARFVIERSGNHIQAVMPFVDVLFGSRDEALAMADFMHWRGPREDMQKMEPGVDEIARMCAQWQKANSGHPRIVVFTQGKDAVWTAVARFNSDGQVVGDVQVQQHFVPSVPREEIIDTTGAGDALCGGFLSGLAQGHSLERCVRMGMYASGVVIRKRGVAWHE